MNQKASVWILGDQLLEKHPALRAAESQRPRQQICVVMVESTNRITKLPYHKKKIALLLSAMRHYARALEAQGYQVDYRKSTTVEEGLRAHQTAFLPGEWFMMAASEHRGRIFQENLSGRLGLPVRILPNTQFLLGRYNPVPDPVPGKRYVMEHFYRAMRRNFDVLMEGGEPAGGKWNFDRENRKRLPPDAAPPEPIQFHPDEITRGVLEEVREIEGLTGLLEGFNLAVTREEAKQAFEDFLVHRLKDFGPYEDAMSTRSETVFHSVLSPYLNLGLLDPLDLVTRVEEIYKAGNAPINSAEGFIRQIIGWREYIYWQYWRTMPDILNENFWGASRPIPDFFWTGETGMNCLRTVLSRVRNSGYAHHIERLMVVSNFSLLAGLSPGSVHAWFLASFIDAYEWVMAPNVMGMGLHADGGLTATKPYIASANYINKMSDFCGPCDFDPKSRVGPRACPINTLYWHFLIENETTLRQNPRMGPNVLALRHLDQDERDAVVEAGRVFLKSI